MVSQSSHLKGGGKGKGRNTRQEVVSQHHTSKAEERARGETLDERWSVNTKAEERARGETLDERWSVNITRQRLRKGQGEKH